MSDFARFDHWLSDEEGPAALVFREEMVPVAGPDGVLFPASFAPEEGADKDPAKFQGGYNLDRGADGKSNVCLVDTVGSQANRIEPLFALPKYKGLVPRVTIEAGEKRLDLLEAGHRAGDAVVRSTPLQAELEAAFKAVQAGDVAPLARIAPTSLVFGVWDSRNTQAKLPRLVASTIRAYNVRPLTRSAQYVPATEYEKEGLLPPPAELKLTEKKYGERGFSHVPASATHGGVVAGDGVRREVILSLGALRAYVVGLDEAKTRVVQRYILGLSLVAFTAPLPSYLRQGCDLVPAGQSDPDQRTLVHRDGRREPITLSHGEALAFAREAATAFGVGEDRLVRFNKELAKQDVTGEGDGQKSNRARAKAKKEKK